MRQWSDGSSEVEIMGKLFFFFERGKERCARPVEGGNEDFHSLHNMFFS